MFNVFRDVDRILLSLFLIIYVIGLVTMFSSSVDFSDYKYDSPFFHIQRQLIFSVLAFVGFYIALNFKLEFWEKYSWLFLFGSFFLLVLVILIGKEVNGSKRWINLGVFNLQASEFAKVGVLMYLASYLLRRQEEVRAEFMGMFKPMVVLGVMIVLLLLEPDFGSVVVLSSACLSMIYLSGVRFIHFFGLLATCGALGLATVLSSEYRLRRLSCFLDPWDANHVYDCGYQLTQSLIAIGSGGWFGVGLGNSVQKLFYLPESHTDFVFAILAEELGLVGGFLVLGLFAALIYRIMKIARNAEVSKKFFGAYFAYGIAMIFGIQVFINIGVNTGLLPTKGLTLPFFSYGGSSLLVSAVLIAFVLRVDYETRFKKARIKKRTLLPRPILKRLRNG